MSIPTSISRSGSDRPLPPPHLGPGVPRLGPTGSSSPSDPPRGLSIAAIGQNALARACSKTLYACRGADCGIVLSSSDPELEPAVGIDHHLDKRQPIMTRIGSRPFWAGAGRWQSGGGHTCVATLWIFLLYNPVQCSQGNPAHPEFTP